MEWYEKNKVRFALEIGLLKRHHPDARKFIDNNQLIILKKIFHQRTYFIKMIYPRNFPYSQPKVFMVKPKFRTNDQYEDGSLCLFPPNKAGPQISGKMILDWTVKFLKDYETGKIK